MYFVYCYYKTFCGNLPIIGLIVEIVTIRAVNLICDNSKKSWIPGQSHTFDTTM